MDLSTHIGGGLTIRNPVMMASGTIGHGAEYAGVLDFAQVGGVVTKTITNRPRAGNTTPRTAETPSGMLNSIGLTNPGIDAFIEEKVPALQALSTARIVSIAGTSNDEFAEMARRFNDIPEIDALELNISSPNMKDGGQLFGCRETAAYGVTAAVKAVSRLPVIVKLTPNVTDIAVVAAAVEEGGADSIALINTLLGLAVDIGTRRPVLGNVTGGLSGPAVKPVALAMVWRVANTVSIPVVGMGGIETAEDAIEFLIVGASAVQVGTTTFINPWAALEIVDGLAEYCRSQRIGRISDLVGSFETGPRG